MPEASSSTADLVEALAALGTPSVQRTTRSGVPFLPGRVVLQDFTGVPAVVDLASMRDAVASLNGDVTRINPLVPADLVIDHSVQVDRFGTDAGLRPERRIWSTSGTANGTSSCAGRNSRFRTSASCRRGPASCIRSISNIIAPVVMTRQIGAETFAFPDTLVGTDSHTTMVNALGVLGWGVGGIEAEAVLLGQPLYLLSPEVVGVDSSGRCRKGRPRPTWCWR